MTPSLLARLFGVPLIIISLLVGCAVIVVVLFGSISSDRQRPISDLLTILETGSGEKPAGVLLPQEQELWQVALELALRLQKKETELTPGELPVVVDRLAELLAREAARSDRLTEMGRKKMHFVMDALAWTESPEAVDPLLAMLDDRNAETRLEAVKALGELAHLPEAQRAVQRVLHTLEDDDTVVRIASCVLLSSLGKPGDSRVVEALDRAYYDDEREVRWNAALTLARLGSLRGASLLQDMLRRDFWEQEVKARVLSGTGPVREYPMPPGAVNRYLLTAIDAASFLLDEDLWSKIEVLAEDPSTEVREAARAALSRRRSSPTA